jgi:hypothetical protein
MNSENSFGLKNNESGPIHDAQIQLNKLNVKLTKTLINEAEFKNKTTQMQRELEEKKNNLIRNNRKRKANASQRLFIAREVKIIYKF